MTIKTLLKDANLAYSNNQPIVIDADRVKDFIEAITDTWNLRNNIVSLLDDFDYLDESMDKVRDIFNTMLNYRDSLMKD